MPIKKIFTILAGLLFVAAFVPYILAIWRDRKKPPGTPGKMEPSKTSWIIWATLDSITIAGMFVEHTLNGQIIGAVPCAWTTAILAIKYGKSGWTKLDKFCLGGAVLGIALWQTFSNPVLGIATSLSVVFIGSFPTFASAWRDPHGEDKAAWTLFWLSCVAAMIAIPRWTLADAAQPIVFTVIETVMMFLLWIRPRFMKARQINV